MAVFDLNQPASSLSEEDDVAASSLINTGFDSHVVSVSSSINTGCDSFASHDDNASSSNILKTPKAVIHHEFIDTPGGSVYWVPRVSASVLPVLGTVYDSLDECIEVYRKYASEAGFGIRLSCQKRLKCGYVKQKYIVCNREGCPKEVWLNTLDPKKNDRQVRSSNFRVCGCKARVVFDMVPHTSKYTLTTFDVEHNHELDRVEYKHLSKAERKLTYNEQLFIIKTVNANIGAVRAHNLYTGLTGSSSLVYGTQTEFKNFTRGINCFIGDSDAQMLVTKIEERQEYTKDYSFDYFVEDAELCDNHRKFVTVGSRLLKKETAESYGWLLRAFKKAFVHPPNIVVTDQDGSMRLVVAAEFPESKHRLCMWHIMQKIPAKIVSRIYDDTDFKDKFGKIVWNMFIGPEEFEDRWNKLMEEFNLVNHKWLSKMYRLRSSWVPAFFVDSPLCGLMRTTSRSESENSFFSYFTSSGSTLVKFMICYESVMERQRHTQIKLDHQSFDSFTALLTPLPIEEHAAKVLTIKNHYPLPRIDDLFDQLQVTPIVDSAAHCRNRGVTDWYQKPKIIMVNVFPPDHVDNLPEVEPNKGNLAPAILEPALVDEDEEPADIGGSSYLLRPGFDLECEDAIKVKDMVEPEDEIVLNSVNEALVEKKWKSNDKCYGKLILDSDNEVRSSVEEGATALENLVRKFGNAEEGVKCKKLKKELEETRLSNILLRMQNEQVERDLYWTRVQAHEFYQEMIHRGVVFEERLNETINVQNHATKSDTSDSVVERMITQRVNKALTVDRASECAERKKVKFAAATLQGPALTWWNSKVATVGLEAVNQFPGRK
ncbi:DNA-directed DNA polymerase [Tanacetum coccineum]|uniref:DNA-directed DNA polymerase n=1 Tax=Tanacetum coccineum TaxID=301880 RepID=A0ABQ5FGL9_9ASTR